MYSLPGPERIEYARRTEKAALDFDARIKNSEGGSFDAATGRKVLANSQGFVGEYSRSYCSVAAVPIAQTEDGGMQRDYWFSVARMLKKLDAPEKVGRIAAERTIRRLGARRVKTARVPVVFDPMVSMPVPLLAIFQPSEETYPSGARLIAERMPVLLDPLAVLGAHVHPELEWGSVAIDAGPVNASCDAIEIEISGAASHGAAPGP